MNSERACIERIREPIWTAPIDRDGAGAARPRLGGVLRVDVLVRERAERPDGENAWTNAAAVPLVTCPMSRTRAA